MAQEPLRNITPAFHVARTVNGAVHVFQVYVQGERIYFIRVGAGPGADYAVAAQGGLVGALIGYWISSRRKKAQAERIEENRSKTLTQMLAEHKVNRVMDVADVSEGALEPGGWTLKKGTVLWRFNLRGEKKRVTCNFRKPEDVEAGIALLPRLFPDLRMDVALDQKSGRYLKKPK